MAGGGSRNSVTKKSTMGRGAKGSGGGGGGRSSGGGAATKKQKKNDADEVKIATQKQKASTLEELIDAVSDDDDGDDDEEYEDEESDEDDDDDDDDDAGEGGDGDDEKRAHALRKMIRDGKFDELLKPKTSGANEDVNEDEEDVKEEDDDDDEEEDDEGNDEEDDEDEEEDEAEKDDGSPANNEREDKSNGDGDEEDSSSEEEGDNNINRKGNHHATSNSNNSASVRSLALHTSALSSDRHLPWPESFAVTAVTPLPFTSDAATTSTTSTKKKSTARDVDEYEEEMDNGEGSGGVDVHDDLAREVAFYDTALECTTLAREQCEKFGIPFARPEDFFAEMVKSDDHMAKIKDRLIYETKKMDAVQRRKSNKEHTLMAKERNAHRLAEKAKSKKAHMSAVDDWKKDVERNRSGRFVGDSQEDDGRLRGMMGGRGGGGGGPNKRRESANKRYGFGGKTDRFKQNDQKTLNDMSGFNPRGGFAGGGRKTPGGSGGGKKRSNSGGGKKRPGKRARDSARSR